MRPAYMGMVIVVYDLIIGILLMLASEKIGSFVRRLGANAPRYLRLATFTFGGCITAVAGFCCLLWIMPVYHYMFDMQ
jgi:hypothetical protein